MWYFNIYEHFCKWTNVLKFYHGAIHLYGNGLNPLVWEIVECVMEINMLMYCYICDNYYSAPRDLHHLRRQSWLVQRWPNIGTTVPTLSHRWATPVTLRDKIFGAHQCTDFLLTLFFPFQFTYKADQIQLTFLQLLSSEATQEITYLCKNSVAYYDERRGNFNMAAKFMTHNDVELVAERPVKLRYDVSLDECRVCMETSWKNTISTSERRIS